ncbi:winged helix-turn-helix domain-containing protein [Novosphingobium aquiterrae]|uniref:Winged helix-turn-helix domain-containing protein n=1 Tax=Novosphingobium aquiterrae TaxID=624388 RepID=A0ABV6PKV2_9SPHN
MPAGLPLARWLDLNTVCDTQRSLTAMLGIDDPMQRARLLNMGFGEAASWQLSLDELEARVLRMVERAQMVGRRRQVGALLLDLVLREGFVAGRALGLYPREFALLWRLADDPGRAVPSGALLGDVWRLSFRPETNSLAVHVSRVRAKLRLAGLDGLIETTADGAYRLAIVAGPGPLATVQAASADQLPLDAHIRLRKEQFCEQT